MSVTSRMIELPDELWHRVARFGDLRGVAACCRRLYATLNDGGNGSVVPIGICATPARVLRGGLFEWLERHHAARLRILTIDYSVPVFTHNAAYFQSCDSHLLSTLTACHRLTDLSLRLVDGRVSLEALGLVLADGLHDLCHLRLDRTSVRAPMHRTTVRLESFTAERSRRSIRL